MIGLKEYNTGISYISWEDLVFPLDFPLSQPIDLQDDGIPITRSARHQEIITESQMLDAQGDVTSSFQVVGQGTLRHGVGVGFIM